MTALLVTLGEISGWIVGKIGAVLTMFTDANNLILVLLLGLMITGAIFSFGMRLIHRR